MTITSSKNSVISDKQQSWLPYKYLLHYNFMFLLFVFGIKRMLYKTLIVFLGGLIISEAQNESRVVTIGQGPVRGYKASNSEVFEFFGIPYATAPTGTDKFQAPLPAPSWTETLEAVENNIACPQHPVIAGSSTVREDCLIVNVFTPSSQETDLPVVVYIHGGSYISGFSMLGSPIPLVESQKIIAVTINYRLGVHGFLCLGTEAVPGNAGLRDMIAALHWVKDNIASFGGNPDDVTLAGYSAGASAADLISLSKVADGLFNKVILESGAHVAAWSVQIDPIKNAQEYAQKLDFNHVGNLAALEEFYTTAPYELLLSDLSRLENYNSDAVFVPCIENDLGQERILDDSPLNILRNNEYTKRPVLHGYANREGMFRMPQFDSWAPKMNEKFSDFLLIDLDFEDENEKEIIAQNIKEFYFGSNSVGLYTLFDYIDYFTDALFAYPILKSVKLQAEAGNEQIYLYEYTFHNYYVPEPGVPDVLVNFPGADHCAQTYAILTNAALESENADRFTEEYKQMRVQMRELWVNFVTTGMPVPEGSSFPAWPPANATRSPHMILGDTITLGDALNEHRATFWDDIYDSHYRHPKPPTFVEPEPESDNAGIISASIILNVVMIITNVIR